MKKQVMMLGLSVLLCGCGGKSVEKEGTGTYTNDSGEKMCIRDSLAAGEGNAPAAKG